MLSTRNQSQSEGNTQTESKGMKKISCKCKLKKCWGNNTLYHEKMDFKTRTIIRDNEKYFIMMKGWIQQDNIILVNTYAPDIGAAKI